MKKLCSDCFKNAGVRQLAFKYGEQTSATCKRCGSKAGKLINKESAERILDEYIIDGTRPSLIMPGVYIHHNGKYNPDIVMGNIDKESMHDIKLLSEIGVFAINYNMPKTFQAGGTNFGYEFDELLNENQKISNHTNKLIEKLDEVLQFYKCLKLSRGTNIYRIRVNPKNPELDSDFDTPPLIYRKANNRLNDIDFPVFYGAFDIETCIYESKFESEDDLYFIQTELKKSLKLVDLSTLVDSQSKIFKDPFIFEDMLYFTHFVFNTYRYLKFTQLISRRIYELGYHGVVYPSYYSRFRGQHFNNIALFGEPIKSGLLSRKSIGRVIMNKIKYDYSFGPVKSFNEN